ncbi:beta-lactamase hydrolase domain-containing protein [Xylella fastidiosa]|uniref:beta-lactamase hydrolase domain-containing protein n=1 Tax=Xylella fastidiosa TaxID=2371 RepID=UPI001961021C
MQIVDINERLAISGQPNTDEFINFARRGYRSIINLRPDGEEPNQPGNDAEQAAARRAGLAYNFVPVIGTSITDGRYPGVPASDSNDGWIGSGPLQKRDTRLDALRAE